MGPNVVAAIGYPGQDLFLLMQVTSRNAPLPLGCARLSRKRHIGLWSTACTTVDEGRKPLEGLSGSAANHSFDL